MIDYQEDWLLLLIFRKKGSVTLRACAFAVPCAMLAFFLVWLDEFAPTSSFRRKTSMLGLDQSQFWSAITATVAMLLAFRTNRAMARFWEGTGLLHQMRGEWFDSISCCVTFSHLAINTEREQVLNFRHALVRLMSLCHGSALEEIGDSNEFVDCIDPWGLDDKTLLHLNDCKKIYHFNRVEVLLHLTQTLITKAFDQGILKISPPILSRVYQTLSRGFVNLLNAKKIADTRFPFPYAQLIASLLFIHMILTPVMMSCLIPHKLWAPIFTFVPIFAMFSINLIGIELENPFGTDDNDLPLHHFQGEMNKCLLMLVHSSADLVPAVHPTRCIKDFEELESQVHGSGGTTENVWERPEGIQTHRLSNWMGLEKRIAVDSTRSSGSNLGSFCSTVGGEPRENGSCARFSIEAASTSRVSNANSSSTSKLGEAQSEEKQELEDDNEARRSQFAASSTNVKVLENDESNKTQPDLPELHDVVQTQVHELSQSINALKEFSNALPILIDRMIAVEGFTTQRHDVLWRSVDTVASSSVPDITRAPYGSSLLSEPLSTTRRWSIVC